MKTKHPKIFLLSIILFLASVTTSYSNFSENKSVFEDRRERLFEKINDGVVIFKTDQYDANFFYLTGFEEGHAACLLSADEKDTFILFIQPKITLHSIWTEKGFSLDSAKSQFKADEVYPLDSFNQVFQQQIKDRKKIFYDFKDDALNTKVIEIFKNTWTQSGKQIINPLPMIHEMRLIKDEQEIFFMKEAALITCRALVEVMRSVEPGMYEYEIQALIEYVFRKEGASGPGFNSIVGSGKNTTILHYESNDRQSQNGDLLLMDIGADYDHYKADVTRTIPVNGTFSQEQAEIYKIVLASQEAAIAYVKPGRGIREIHNRGVEVLKEGLHKLGLIIDKTSDWQHRVWLMYSISHWLGLDVHDVGGRGDDDAGRMLEPGMVLTVEPGVYINERSLNGISDKLGDRFKVDEKEIQEFVSAVKPVVQKYMNIGVRIEDDILVTKEGFENLSRYAPKEIRDIEKQMKRKARKKGDDDV